VRCALYCSKIVSYAQGYMLLKAAAKENGWNLNFGGIALMWRGGCIIRSQFSGQDQRCLRQETRAENLLLDSFFTAAISKYQASWRKALFMPSSWVFHARILLRTLVLRRLSHGAAAR